MIFYLGQQEVREKCNFANLSIIDSRNQQEKVILPILLLEIAGDQQDKVIFKYDKLAGFTHKLAGFTHLKSENPAIRYSSFQQVKVLPHSSRLLQQLGPKVFSVLFIQVLIFQSDPIFIVFRGIQRFFRNCRLQGYLK